MGRVKRACGSVRVEECVRSRAQNGDKMAQNKHFAAIIADAEKGGT